MIDKWFISRIYTEVRLDEEEPEHQWRLKERGRTGVSFSTTWAHPTFDLQGRVQVFTKEKRQSMATQTSAPASCPLQLDCSHQKLEAPQVSITKGLQDLWHIHTTTMLSKKITHTHSDLHLSFRHSESSPAPHCTVHLLQVLLLLVPSQSFSQPLSKAAKDHITKSKCSVFSWMEVDGMDQSRSRSHFLDIWQTVLSIILRWWETRPSDSYPDVYAFTLLPAQHVGKMTDLRNLSRVFALKCLYLSWLTESFAIHDAAHDTLLHFSASHQQKLSCQASICATPCPPHSRYSYFLCSFPQLLLSWAFLPSPPLGLGYTRTGKRTFHIPS